jgi:proteasome lid subunit RPN8/RPN11
MPEDPHILMPAALLDRLVATIRERLPEKCFGYIVSDVSDTTPSDFFLFRENVRNSPDWKDRFESYGRYFVDHADAGFVATSEESWRVQNEIWRRDLFEVAAFHSHQRHPANFSQIDYEMHIRRFPDLWHLIVSMRNPELPQVRAFAISSRGVRELPLHIVQRETGGAPAGRVVSAD